MSSHSFIPAGLPVPDSESAAHMRAVEQHLVQQIEQAPWGFMPFEQWMNLVLYAPGLGYYAAGKTKFGGLPDGDFTTAPELTPLFGQTLARQVAQILQASDSVKVLEFGAGSGALAASLIPALRTLGIEPDYQILEVSADLRARQQRRLAGLESSVSWLDALPTGFVGCVLANEVLDAMPVRLFRWNDAGHVLELGVTLGHSHADENEISLRRRRAGGVEASLGQAHLDAGTDAAHRAVPFLMAEREAEVELAQIVAARMPPLPEYQSEINLQAEVWVRQMGEWLEKGAALLIDYGFPRNEYYHPQRAGGTLMCHFRHHAHSQPLIYPGLQDITAHIDFTAMADAALEGGLDVMGYTSQARFLLNAGLADLLTGMDPGDTINYAQAASAAQKLLSEAEMGELFKVLAIGKNISTPLLGFAGGDRRHRL